MKKWQQSLRCLKSRVFSFNIINMTLTLFKYNSTMNSKKIWSLLLLFAISFSAVHDYTFAALDDKHSSIEAYVTKLSSQVMGEYAGMLCDIHFEYHMPYMFLDNHISFPIVDAEDGLFAYDEIFFSLDYFNFFKPPIA